VRQCTPSKRDGDQEIDRRIFEEIDAIHEERDRSNGFGNRELEPKIGQVQERNDDNDSSQVRVHGSNTLPSRVAQFPTLIVRTILSSRPKQ
jgi:hypothetical protein